MAGVHEAKYTQSISSLTNYTDVNKKKIKCDVDILFESKTFRARAVRSPFLKRKSMPIQIHIQFNRCSNPQYSEGILS
ncbi:MAG TPA: hypothetical protein VIP53_09615, partial [Nitrososphaera sp.]